MSGYHFVWTPVVWLWVHEDDRRQFIYRDRERVLHFDRVPDRLINDVIQGL